MSLIRNKTSEKMPLIIDSEDFSYYADGFHDGSIYKIKTTEKKLAIEMETTEMYICDNRDSIPLSERNTLYGILHVRGVRSMKNNGIEVSSLEIEYDHGHLLNFDLSKHSLCMSGYWVGYGVNAPKEEKYFKIEVEATEIYWENTANITDPVLLGKFMGLEGPPPYDYPPWYCEKYNIEPSGESKKNTGLGVQNKDEDAK